LGDITSADIEDFFAAMKKPATTTSATMPC
jgi:hypothetical protein